MNKNENKEDGADRVNLYDYPSWHLLLTLVLRDRT